MAPRYDRRVSETRDPLNDLEEQLGYRFRDLELLRQALRHGSAVGGSHRRSYQRLEFLGDAVLGHAIVELLFERFPERDEGDLTKMKAYLVRSEKLAELAALLGLDGYVEMGWSEERAGGNRRTALLEDVLEAVIGALSLDGGWEVARGFVEELFEREIRDLDDATLRLADPKSALFEAAQARQLPQPEFRLVQEGGGSGRPWAFELIWDGKTVARGEGPTKKAAQAQACRRALIRLGLVNPPGS